MKSFQYTYTRLSGTLCFLGALLCAIAGCNAEGAPPIDDLVRPTSHTNILERESEASKIIVVYADLTTSSNDTVHVADINRHLEQILLQAPYESEIVVYPIDRSVNTRPILEFQIPEKPVNTNARKAGLKAVQKAIAEAQLGVRHLFDEIYFPERIEANSCLINGLDKAYDIFSDYPKDEGQQFEVVFLSDMIEECDGVFMRSNLHTFPTFIESYDPQFDLSFAKISIVMSTQAYSTDTESVSHKQLVANWKQVLSRVGYDEEALRALSFSNRLPKDYRKSRHNWEKR